MIQEIGFYAFLHTSSLSNEIGILPLFDLQHRLGYLYHLTIDPNLKNHIQELIDYLSKKRLGGIIDERYDYGSSN